MPPKESPTNNFKTLGLLSINQKWYEKTYRLRISLVSYNLPCISITAGHYCYD